MQFAQKREENLNLKDVNNNLVKKKIKEQRRGREMN